MALKDWKKQTWSLYEDDYHIAWVKGEGEQRHHLHVSRTSVLTEDIALKTNKRYVFWGAVYSGNPFILRGFDNLSSANTFAKNYMRSH